MARKSSKSEKKDIEKQKLTLMERRENLVNSLIDLSNQGKKAEKKGDSSDLAASSRDEELNLLLSDHERQELRAIDSALKRIEEGNYGLCEECGNSISFKRLEALPFAKYCRDCQAEIENKDKIAKLNKTERLVNLFSDTIKLTGLDTEGDDEEVPSIVGDINDDMENFELEGKDLDDLQEGDENPDKD